MDWDDIKDNFEMGVLCAGFVVGGILIAPFYGVYLIGKGVYHYLLKNVRERKRQEQELREREERQRKQDEEIRLLEEQLGLDKRKDASFYDPFYYKNPKWGKRDEYLKDLKQKVADGYASPDLIVAVECYDPLYYEKLYWKQRKKSAVYGRPCDPIFRMGIYDDKEEDDTFADKKCYVTLLVRESCYGLPENPLIRHRDAVKDEYIGQVVQGEARQYVYGFECYMKYFAFHPSQMTEPHESYFRRLYTLTECGRYEDYRVVQVPGEFQFSDVEAGTDERLNKFIEDFKRKYKKMDGL